MFIKWKYNDHGWGDFKELEIPDWATKEYNTLDESIMEYIVENCRIPTWSERYDSCRIHWEKVDKTKEQLEEINKKKIAVLKANIAIQRKQIKELEDSLSGSLKILGK